MKLVVSPQTIKRVGTSVDAANVLSFLVSEDAGFITADSAGGRRLQSKRGIGFKSLWTQRVRSVVPTYGHGNIPSFVMKSKNVMGSKE
jgi:hypothetical protein